MAPARPDSVPTMGIEELYQFLQTIHGSNSSLAMAAKKLHEEQIDGPTLLEFTEEDIDSLGFKMGPKRALLKLIKSIKDGSWKKDELEKMKPAKLNPPANGVSRAFREAPPPPDLPPVPPEENSPEMVNGFKLSDDQLTPALRDLRPGQDVVLSSQLTGMGDHDLKLEAMAQRQGNDTHLKYMISFNSEDAKYNMRNYDTFLASFGDQEGNIIGHHIMQVVPQSSLRPAITYEFVNCLTGEKINKPVRLVIKGKDFSTEVTGTGTVTFPKDQVEDGVVELCPMVEGYDLHTEQLIQYQGMTNDCQVVRILLNPKDTLKNARITLRWSEHPRDLDIHCVTTDGRHVYFSSKDARDINLDTDVQHGRGPETISINKWDRDVTYYIYVHHYAGKSTIYNSQATLDIMGINGLNILRVPPTSVSYSSNHQEMFWRCFSVCNGRVRVLNDVVRISGGSATTLVKW